MFVLLQELQDLDEEFRENHIDILARFYQANMSLTWTGVKILNKS